MFEYQVGERVFFKNDDFDAIKNRKYIPCIVKHIDNQKMVIVDIDTNTDLYIQKGFNDDLVYKEHLVL